MPKHLTLAELAAGLPEILASPADEGTLRAIVVRPYKTQRRDLQTCEISLALGTHGDHWAKGCGVGWVVSTHHLREPKIRWVQQA